MVDDSAPGTQPPAGRAPVPRSPAELVQHQLDAYNARDVARFVEVYHPDVELFRPPEPEPFLRGRDAMAEHYRTRRFHQPGLHAALMHRIVIGNTVFDHEQIVGIALQPVQAMAVFQIADGLIRRVWFFDGAQPPAPLAQAPEPAGG